jgi:hypothetical protein
MGVSSGRWRAQYYQALPAAPHDQRDQKKTQPKLRFLAVELSLSLCFV